MSRNSLAGNTTISQMLILTWSATETLQRN